MAVTIKIKPSSNKAKNPSQKSSFKPVVDKITITIKVPASDFGDIYSALHEVVQEVSDFLPSKTKTANFDFVQLIAIPGTTERVHFMFGAKKSYLPDARLNFNPAKLGPQGMQHLHEILCAIFPGGWGYVIEHGRVSQMDLAIDFPGVRMHHFSVLPDMVITTKTYADQGKLKTIYSGKQKGNQLKVYSKSHELWVKTKKKGPKGPAVVRVEKRLTNVGKPLKDLAAVENPFLAFKLVAHPQSPPPGEQKTYIWSLFLDSVAQRGLGPALKLLPQNKMSAYRKHFAAHVQPWWDPIAIWSNWPDALKESKLLPP